MKRRKPIHNNPVFPWGGRYLSAFPNILLALSLGLGSVVSAGCVAIPAVMVTSAAVTAAAVVSEGERLIRHPDAQSSIIVRNGTDGDSFSREACQRHEALPEEDQPGVQERHEMRDSCLADRHEPETLRDPNRPRT